MPLISKRPCCQLLRQLAQRADQLRDPGVVANALEVLSRECVLMRTLGKSRVSIDAVKLNCFLHVSPESDNLSSEIGKTVAANLGLQQKYYLLFGAINEILSKNANSQQISEFILPLLAEIRDGERKFGAVLAETKTQLDAGNSLEQTHTASAHPLLSLSQTHDGTSDRKAVALPTENTESQQKAQELTYQPAPGIVNQPGMQPHIAPALKPTGAGR